MTPATEQNLRRGILLTLCLLVALMGLYLLVALLLVLDVLVFKTDIVLKLSDPAQDALRFLYVGFFKLIDKLNPFS